MAIIEVLYLNPAHIIKRITTSRDTKRGAVDKEHKEAMLTSCFNTHFDKIAHYIYIRLGDKAEAEDLASEVFLKSYKSLDSFQQRGVPMQAWLFRIAHNLLVDHHRKQPKMKTVQIDDNLQIADNEDTMASALVNIECDRVVQLLDRLTPDQRQVIELRFFGGLTSDEVGTVMSKSSGAVRQMQSYAIKRLRQLLEKR